MLTFPDRDARKAVALYEAKAKDEANQIHRIAEAFGLDEALLREMMTLRLTEDSLNEYGRFDRLKDIVDK